MWSSVNEGGRHYVSKVMRRTLRWNLGWVVACSICSLVTYRIAHHRGYETGYRSGVVTAIRLGHFGQSLGSLAALQHLREGDIPRATRLMETICFDSAHMFYKEPIPSAGEASQWGRAQGLSRFPGPAEAKSLAQELLKYRAAYRTNSADWDIMERDLDVELAQVR
jgi:hypothetical protein